LKHFLSLFLPMISGFVHQVVSLASGSNPHSFGRSRESGISPSWGWHRQNPGGDYPKGIWGFWNKRGSPSHHGCFNTSRHGHPWLGWCKG
jgi:hypothetical protein